MCLQYKSFENTAGKGEIARNEQFLLSHNIFNPFEKLPTNFIKLKIVVCKLFHFEDFTFGKGLIFYYIRESRLHLSLKVYAHWILHPNSRETKNKIFHLFPKHSIVIKEQKKPKY